MKKHLLTALVVTALTLSSCGAADSATFDRAEAEDVMTESVYMAGSAAKPSGTANGKGMYDYVMDMDGAEPSQSAATAPLAERKVIRTMRITAETKNFDDAAASFETLCASLGGYVESSSRSGGSLRYDSSRSARSANYTFRIPAENLDAFRLGIDGDINIVSESTNVNDITDQYYDVDTRISTLKTEEERLLAMLEKATELEYLITLEKRLSEVRYEIESYTGTIRRYDSQVSYSTVHLNLEEVIEYTEPIEEPTSFGDRIVMAFNESWEEFYNNCCDLAVVLVYCVPTLLVIAAVGGITAGITISAVNRSKRKKNGK